MDHCEVVQRTDKQLPVGSGRRFANYNPLRTLILPGDAVDPTARKHLFGGQEADFWHAGARLGGFWDFK